ncbi:MAG: hypothetical protein ACI4IF_02345, partial [Acutalibacteraceae bacterium]
LSKWTKSNIINAITEYADSEGINIDKLGLDRLTHISASRCACTLIFSLLIPHFLFSMPRQAIS